MEKNGYKHRGLTDLMEYTGCSACFICVYIDAHIFCSLQHWVVFENSNSFHYLLIRFCCSCVIWKCGKSIFWVVASETCSYWGAMKRIHRKQTIVEKRWFKFLNNRRRRRRMQISNFITLERFKIIFNIPFNNFRRYSGAFL